MSDTSRVFDETSLHQDIIRTWGEHGAHNDVMTAMRQRLAHLDAEIEQHEATIERLRQRLSDLVGAVEVDYSPTESRGKRTRLSIIAALSDTPQEADQAPDALLGDHDTVLLTRTDDGVQVQAVGQVGWQLCVDGTLWKLDDPAHAGRCPLCTPLYAPVRDTEGET